MTNPKNHPLWPKFAEFMREHDPDAMRSPDIWGHDWLTFIAGSRETIAYLGSKGRIRGKETFSTALETPEDNDRGATPTI